MLAATRWGVVILPAKTFMSTNVEKNLGLIFGRRSIRLYSAGAVSEAAVQKLLEAAMAAPSAAAKDPWRFVVVRDRRTLTEIAAALPNGQMIAGAALGIAVCGDLQAAHDQQLSYLLQDCSAAIENLLLCAHALGLGACWLGVHPREQRLNSLKQILSLPPSVIPVACISIGYPAEVKEPRTRFNRDYVHFDRW
jgi:nitroreductase